MCTLSINKANRPGLKSFFFFLWSCKRLFASLPWQYAALECSTQVASRMKSFPWTNYRKLVRQVIGCIFFLKGWEQPLTKCFMSTCFPSIKTDQITNIAKFCIMFSYNPHYHFNLQASEENEKCLLWTPISQLLLPITNNKQFFHCVFLNSPDMNVQELGSEKKEDKHSASLPCQEPMPLTFCSFSKDHKKELQKMIKNSQRGTISPCLVILKGAWL